MNKDVRLGRKEYQRDLTAKRKQVHQPDQQRTDRERETRKRHKAASKARSAVVKDLFFFFGECGVPPRDELLAEIQRLVGHVRFGGIPPERHAHAIFDPAITDLTSLPLGLLCGKEETLPLELLPDTRLEIETHCRRMISRKQDDHVINTVLEGWPGLGRGSNKFQEHVSDLWKLYETNSPLYRLLLCGQHGEAILDLRRNRLPRGFSRERLELMLARHGLLFCTNDIQLNLAHNAVAERNPMEALISSDYIKLAPERVVNDLRPYLTLLKLLLQLYVTQAEVLNGRKEPAEVPDDPIANPLKASILFEAGQTGVDLMALRPRLDETIPFIKQLLARSDDRLLQELGRPVSANELEKSFSAIWFSGLSNLQASAVPVLRYIQAEAELEQEVRQLVPQPGDTVELREGTALRPFLPKRLKGWRDRARGLLHAYRQAHLADADAKIGEVRNKQTGDPPILKASNFLVRGGQRLIPDHEGGPDCPRRTYYLLDIVPEHRLALQKDMVKEGPAGEFVVAARIY